MIDQNLNPTQGAKELAKAHTVAQLRDMLQTEFGVKPPSKAVKIEIAQQLDDNRHNATTEGDVAAPDGLGQRDENEAIDEWHAFMAEQGVHVDARFGGDLEEAGAADRIFVQPDADQMGDTLRVISKSLGSAAERLDTVGLAARAAAQKLAAVAWAHQVAVVRSMGHTVRGSVVDVALRAPGPDGTGRVCLVVQHNGHPTRRTLHALSDVKFEALAS